jgi:hypothetical protein
VGANRTGDEGLPPERRYTVAEATRILDTTAEAVRSRIKRGTLESVKDGATVYVLLSADRTPPERSRATTNQPTKRERIFMQTYEM